MEFLALKSELKFVLHLAAGNETELDKVIKFLEENLELAKIYKNHDHVLNDGFCTICGWEP
jgi:mRNA-degrading endonuclease YafQ of YafQ-DinJ toxin-antitoxin module